MTYSSPKHSIRITVSGDAGVRRVVDFDEDGVQRSSSECIAIITAEIS